MPVDRFGEVNSEGKQRLRFNLNGMILFRHLPVLVGKNQALRWIESFVFTPAKDSGKFINLTIQ